VFLTHTLTDSWLPGRGVRRDMLLCSFDRRRPPSKRSSSDDGCAIGIGPGRHINAAGRLYMVWRVWRGRSIVGDSTCDRAESDDAPETRRWRRPGEKASHAVNRWTAPAWSVLQHNGCQLNHTHAQLAWCE